MTSSVVLDAGVLIAYLDAADGHHRQSVDAIKALGDDAELLACSVSVSEVLVRPARSGMHAVLGALQSIRRDAGVEIVPADLEIAVDVAVIRSRHRAIRTPDAMVLATARTRGASFALTTDSRLARMDEAVSVKQFLKS